MGGSVKDIKIPDIKDDSEEITYLLDGQQRTTTLTYAFTEKSIFKNNNKIKSKPINLYWDSKYIGDDVEIRWCFDDETLYIKDTEQHYKISDLEFTGELYKKFNTRFVKIKHAFDRDWDNLISIELFEDELQYLKFSRDYDKKLRILQDKILKRKVVEIEQKGDLNTVLDVFERINTKNTKLSLFDIMVAKTYKKYEEGYFDLRNFFRMISSGIKTVDNDYFKNLENIEIFEEKKVFDENTLLCLSTVAVKEKFQVKEVLKITTDEFINEIKHLHFVFNRLYEILENNFFIETKEQNKYQPIAKFVVAFLTKFPKEENTPEFKEFIKKWYWNTVIYNRYPGAQNERIEKDFKRTIDNKDNLDNALRLMRADNSRAFEIKANIRNLFNCYYNKKSSQIYKMMLVLLKSKLPQDFYTGDRPSKSATKKLVLEEHHIFPVKSSIGKIITKKYQQTNDNIINNIGNIALITKETNSKKISNKNPSIYIKEILEDKRNSEHQEIEFYEYLKTHFITKEMVDYLLNDDFENFIIKRTKLIYLYIKELTT